jgi:hypothetical protein
MKPASVNREAHALMTDPKITARVARLQRRKDRAVVASSITDRERVLDKLRNTLDTTEGGPAVMAQLRAAELLGKSIGLFTEVIESKPTSDKTPAELRALLEQKLKEYFGDSQVSDATRTGKATKHLN